MGVRNATQKSEKYIKTKEQVRNMIEEQKGASDKVSGRSKQRVPPVIPFVLCLLCMLFAIRIMKILMILALK